MKLCRIFALAGVFAAGLLTMAPWARAQQDGAYFLRTGELDFASMLPAPPAPGTLAWEADLDTVLQVQAGRTPAQVAWARRVDARNVLDFADVLGAWFDQANLPVTTAFLQEIRHDLEPGIRTSKQIFAHPRPFMADARVRPCVKRWTDASYPSGHTMDFFVEAGVLAEIFPERRGELFDFAGRMAWGRVIGGVHFPTDLAGGRIAAAAIVEKLDANGEFRVALEKSRAEVAAFLAQAR